MLPVLISRLHNSNQQKCFLFVLPQVNTFKRSNARESLINYRLILILHYQGIQNANREENLKNPLPLQDETGCKFSLPARFFEQKPQKKG
jgi:hypothetical protein